MNEAAKIYAEISPNVVVNVVETPWDDLQAKLTTAVLAGQLDTLPDILLMQDNAAVKNITNFPGVFADLTDSGIDFSQFAEYKSNGKPAHSRIQHKHHSRALELVPKCYCNHCSRPSSLLNGGIWV